MPTSSPDPVDLTFQELQEKYLQRMTGTIDELKGRQQSIGHGSGRSPLQELRLAFHRLAGSGATYGYPAITDVGQMAEKYLDELLDSPDALPSEAASRVAAFIQDLEDAHAAACGS